MNEAINQSIKQSSNQAINQSINQSVTMTILLIRQLQYTQQLHSVKTHKISATIHYLTFNFIVKCWYMQSKQSTKSISNCKKNYNIKKFKHQIIYYMSTYMIITYKSSVDMLMCSFWTNTQSHSLTFCCQGIAAITTTILWWQTASRKAFSFA